MKRFFIALLFSFSISTIFAQSNTITLQIEGVYPAKGNLMIAAFNNSQDFKAKQNPAFKDISKITDSTTILTFKEITSGKYAFAIFHDLNSNQQLDVNTIGIPSEGYGFSGDFNTVFKKPKYKDCSLNIISDTLIKIKMLYW
jgi:uncharacterized protein (DUF2141 family)